MSIRDRLSEEEIEEIREIFDHYDRDANNVIDRDEFRKLLRALAEDMAEDEIEAGLRAVDENHNGKIEFEEFLEWWADSMAEGRGT